MRTLLSSLLLLFCLTAASLSFAQVLVADINQTNRSSFPDWVRSNDSLVVFFAKNENGHLLYALDAGTQSVEPLYSLTESELGTTLLNVVLIDSDLYFTTINDGFFHYQRFDLQNRKATVLASLPYSFAFNYFERDDAYFRLGDRVYFVYDGPDDQFALYGTDGTTTGTNLVTALPNGSEPQNFQVLDNRVYFTLEGDEPAKGEIWTSDGTATGTALFYDTDPDNSNDNRGIRSLHVFQQQLYFLAFHPAYGYEAWVSDGTTAGTSLFRDLYPGPANGTFAIIPCEDRLILRGRDAATASVIFVSDGTPSGTAPFLKVDSMLSDPSIRIDDVYDGGDWVYLNVRNASSGQELWRSDGTIPGTFLLRDINPGSESGITMRPNYTYLNDDLYFMADDGTTGLELWTTDGTSAGTVSVGDLHPGVDGLAPGTFARLGSRFYFSANSLEFGRELWSSDGTAAGSAVVADLNTSTASSSSPADFQIWQDTLYFSALVDCTGRELYRTTGTGGSTQLVKDLYPGRVYSLFSRFVSLGENIYFFAQDPDTGRPVWRSDGSTAGTEVAFDPNGATFLTGGRTPLCKLGDHLIIREYLPEQKAVALLRSDGTAAGTEIYAFTVPEVQAPFIQTGAEFIALGDSLLLFEEPDLPNGSALWRTDGTDEGSFQLVDLDVDLGQSVARNSILYFPARTGPASRTLWRSDGTIAGTYRLSDPALGSLKEIIAFSDQVYFSYVDDQYTTKFGITDGTTAGTIQVPFTGAALDLLDLRHFQVVGERILFNGLNQQTGYEPWSYHPATDSWELIRDINPDYAFGTDFSTTAVWNDSLLIFSANDGLQGTEVWVTDGTSEHTYLTLDLYPGPADSNPHNFFLFHDFVYFSADAGDDRGFELYKYSPLDLDNDGFLPPEDLDDSDPMVNVAGGNNPDGALGHCPAPQTTATAFAEWTTEVAIYPNPATELLTIDAPENSLFQLRFLAENGRILFSKASFTGRLTLPLTQFPPGPYSLQLIDPITQKQRSWLIIIN